VSIGQQGWNIDVLPVKGQATRALDCDVEEPAILRLQAQTLDCDVVITVGIGSARFTLTRCLVPTTFYLTIPIPVCQCIVDAISNYTTPSKLFAAITPSHGLDAWDRDLKSGLEPATPISRGQELDLTLANATIGLVPGRYVLVLESTIFAVIAYDSVPATPPSGGAEGFALPLAPQMPFELFCPYATTLNAHLVAAGTGKLWIVRTGGHAL
jgi:hypothetical protein